MIFLFFSLLYFSWASYTKQAIHKLQGENCITDFFFNIAVFHTSQYYFFSCSFHYNFKNIISQQNTSLLIFSYYSVGCETWLMCQSDNPVNQDSFSWKGRELVFCSADSILIGFCFLLEHSRIAKPEVTNPINQGEGWKQAIVSSSIPELCIALAVITLHNCSLLSK